MSHTPTRQRPEIERRAESSLIELRGRNGGSRRAGGTAMAYGHVSRQMPSFFEVFEPSAFRKSEQDGWPGVRSLIEHDPTKLLADTETKTLTLNNSKAALDYELVLPNTTIGNDALTNIETGLLRYSSVGFRTYQDDFTTTDSGAPLRHIVSAALDECSLTANPAYYSSTVGLRSHAGLRSYAEFIGEDPEEVIRDALAGELRRYTTRTDRAVAAPPTVVPHDENQEDRTMGITGEQAQRWLAAHREPATGIDGRTAAAKLDLMRRRWEIRESDAEIARVSAGSRRYGPDATAREAQLHEQQAAAHSSAVHAEAVRRRLRDLREAGVDYEIPETPGIQWVHPPAGRDVPLPQDVSVRTDIPATWSA